MNRFGGAALALLFVSASWGAKAPLFEPGPDPMPPQLQGIRLGMRPEELTRMRPAAEDESDLPYKDPQPGDALYSEDLPPGGLFDNALYVFAGRRLQTVSLGLSLKLSKERSWRRQREITTALLGLWGEPERFRLYRSDPGVLDKKVHMSLEIGWRRLDGVMTRLVLPVEEKDADRLFTAQVLVTSSDSNVQEPVAMTRERKAEYCRFLGLSPKAKACR